MTAQPTLRQRHSALHATVADFGDAFSDGLTMDRVAPALTCRQAEAIAGIFLELDMPITADMWLDTHARSDDEPEDQHHDRYRKHHADDDED